MGGYLASTSDMSGRITAQVWQLQEKLTLFYQVGPWVGGCGLVSVSLLGSTSLSVVSAIHCH